MSDMVGNPEDRFSDVEAQLILPLPSAMFIMMIEFSSLSKTFSELEV